MHIHWLVSEGRMRLVLMVTALVMILLIAPRAQAQVRGYIPTATGVQIFDVATSTLIGTIPGITNGLAAAFNPSGTRIYVSTLADTVVPIDTATNTLLPAIGVGAVPGSLVVDGAGTFVYVANQNASTVSVISTATNAVVATVPVGAAPNGIALNPSSTRLYVPNRDSGTVSVIDTATNTVVHTINSFPMGTIPQGAVVDSGGTRLYVADQSGFVQVVNLLNDSIVASIATPATAVPVTAVRDPAGTRLYVNGTGFGDELTVIDMNTNTVLTSIVLPGNFTGLSMDPGGGFLYVPRSAPDVLLIVDTGTNMIASSIALASAPVASGNLFQQVQAQAGPGPGPDGPQSIPTLSDYGLWTLSVLVGLAAWHDARRRSCPPHGLRPDDRTIE